MKVGFKNCGKIVSPSDFVIVVRTHARLPYSFSGWIFLQLHVLKKKHVKLGSEKMMSPTYFEIVAIFYKRLPNALLAQILLQLDVLEKEYMEFDLGRIVNCATQAWLPYSFPNRIFLRLAEQEKEYMNQNLEMNIVKIVDKVVENLNQGR